ncbi:hypothetical protein PN462_00740 [Spirulina sp. CS-785/01]|uniref:hypothetical protein n=1 Tax=Spirulina sp. CS-785/01 TaxID=3021716 RepID=UPI00232AD5EA|nr:hypothetical protein [Spirulina sp. CS-785/01]MDB9311608.1 hypothetical protein [Spirulina sp. CS-785/01]
MGRHNPYTLRLEITKMMDQGQSFFCTMKVQDWLKERKENPDDYNIVFHRQPAPPGSKEVMQVEIELQRKDGQPVDPWLQEEVNRQE